MDEDRVGRYTPRHELEFGKDGPGPQGATNMGYVNEKGKPYIVSSENGYDHKL